ncbi:MAG TPA: uroporphyrinogen decarboxylase [Acidimicrobiales bacterium]|nr:uroporphyrinogen decarboxylase [Acidimicrobiales bacterium]
MRESAFLRACRGESVDHVPVWFMRQAGRSLPEYRALRSSGSILEAIAQPDVACEVTLQPVRRYGVDAAILFSDIVVPYHAIDFGIDVVPGRGPVVEDPFRHERDLERLRDLTEDDVAHVTATVERVVAALDPSVPLIGFAGAPFTVASYLVEGAPTREFGVIKTLMHADPGLFDRLCDRLVAITVAFLRAQVAHGARAVQLFDSWAGALSRDEYVRFALEPTRRVLEGVADLDVPTIVFGVGTGEILDLMAECGSSVVGVDWHVDLDRARARVGDRAVQGNLDPARCLGGAPLAIEAAREVLAKAGTAPGHVFNLGHGVLPSTDPSVLEAVVRVVHDEGKAGVR